MTSECEYCGKPVSVGFERSYFVFVGRRSCETVELCEACVEALPGRKTYSESENGMTVFAFEAGEEEEEPPAP